LLSFSMERQGMVGVPRRGRQLRRRDFLWSSRTCRQRVLPTAFARVGARRDGLPPHCWSVYMEGSPPRHLQHRNRRSTGRRSPPTRSTLRDPSSSPLGPRLPRGPPPPLPPSPAL